MSAKKCEICGKKNEVNDGGCVFAFTFANYNSVTISNKSYCRDCYKQYLEEDLRALNDKAKLGIVFENGGEDGN